MFWRQNRQIFLQKCRLWTWFSYIYRKLPQMALIFLEWNNPNSLDFEGFPYTVLYNREFRQKSIAIFWKFRGRITPNMITIEDLFFVFSCRLKSSGSSSNIKLFELEGFRLYKLEFRNQSFGVFKKRSKKSLIWKVDENPSNPMFVQWVNLVPIFFWCELLPTTYRTQKSPKIRFLKVNYFHLPMHLTNE